MPTQASKLADDKDSSYAQHKTYGNIPRCLKEMYQLPSEWCKNTLRERFRAKFLLGWTTNFVTLIVWQHTWWYIS